MGNVCPNLKAYFTIGLHLKSITRDSGYIKAHVSQEGAARAANEVLCLGGLL